MRDEEKTKKELISELQALRKKYTALKEVSSIDRYTEDIRGTETILVVDDNTQMRQFIVDLLEKFGYTLLEADSARKAIETFKSHPGEIQLVLADVVMPGINGPEMIKEILDIQSAVKVVFMSGYAEDEIVHDDVFNLLHAHSPFIKKPFTLREIGLIVRQQLDSTKA